MYRKKYRNSKIRTQEGLEFDSKKEYTRYCQLCILQQDGKIKNLELQKTYELIPKQKLDNPRLEKGRMIRHEKAVTYTADFVYTDVESGKVVVEDTKSDPTKTPQYIIKRKLMKYIHGIEIVEI